MKKSQQIVITGIGAISAAGATLGEHLDAFEAGRRNAGPVSLFSTDLTYPVFEVKNIPEKWQKHGMRTLSLALCAAEEALNDAGLGEDSLSNFKAGVCLGTTVASQLNDIDFYRSYRSNGTASMAPVKRFLRGNLAHTVAQAFNFEGPSLTVVNACSSGADAIGAALCWLKNGICDIAIAGGADELSRIPLCGFGSLGIVSQSLCRPFDRDRTGLNLGEGAGMIVLETESGARQRGRNASLCLAGYGLAGDAYHLTAPRPDGEGLKTALQQALAEAGISSQSVCFVNAHGTATPNNDEVEGNVLADVFGKDIPFLSTKGFTGHTLGAAGGLEAAFTAAALREGWIPASPGFVRRDEKIPISPVAERTPVNGHYAVSTSLAFGGNNAAIVIGNQQTDAVPEC